MYKYFLLLLILACNLSANNWRLVEEFDNTPTFKKSDVKSITCKDSNCFVVVQHGGEVYESSWRLYRSIDYGNTWELLYIAENIFEQEDPIIINVNNGISPNPNNYFISSDDNAVIQKSTDSGKTFKKVLIDSSKDAENWELDDLAMWDSSIGFVTSQYYYYTTKDGWESNKRHPKLHTNQSYYSPFFLDSNTIGMIYGSPWANSMGLGESFVKYYINKNSWDTVFYFGKEPGKWFDAIESIYFVNDTVAYGAGWRSDKSLPSGEYYDIIYKTTDGGYNWNLIFIEFNKPYKGFFNISFADANNGVAVGYYGKIAMTNNGGETWAYVPTPNDLDNCRKMLVTWAGRTPLIGTWDAGIFRYEGDFFNFPPDTTDVVENQEMKEIELYPNPASDYLFLSNVKDAEKIEIITMLGIKLFESEYNDKIDVSQFSPGMYILRMGGKITKFIKY
ncbi:T9SS C-terminal target domain-containing protein [Bacteroidetes/Chlorobi group bacterium ChocPot_Mid]|nr:MAG: T9SS C-terminal target domain-containing protein [Bacteroidetes/Chlorobi group bacterium ChocPot_Mid]